MTAVPLRGTDNDQDSLLVVCDRCGDGFIVENSPDIWILVWRIVSACGWSGSPLAIGPHTCPACSRAADLAARQDPGTD